MKWAIAGAAALVLAFSTGAEARTWRVSPGPDAQEMMQGAFNQARPGDTIRLDEGRFDLWAPLTLDIDRITMRGEGEGRTILSFRGQRQNAEGLLVTADDVTFRDFAVEDARGDGLAARDCARLTLRDLRVEWTLGPNAENGAHGVRALNCSDVLIDGVIARRAAGAGIAIDRSRNIIMRNARAEYNVAGVVIASSAGVDLSHSVSTHNALGLLVTAAPGAGQDLGASIRVFENEIVQNDGRNFAGAASPYADTPAAVGMMIVANRDVHAFENKIGENGSVNVWIAAFGGSIPDAAFNALPRNIVIRQNEFGRVGFSPSGDLASLPQAGVALPDILWDGASNYVSGGVPHTEPVRIALIRNRKEGGGQPTFLSLGIPVAGADIGEAAPDSTPPYGVEMPEPERVRLPQD